MPLKIRELMKQLEKAGFRNRGGKGRHRNFIHPKGIAVTISGNPGSDAKKYQESEVKRKIMESQK
ncbi:MAG: type II toxin-antitoxin system HicA family toxin [Pseudomonadota bacterium]|nr:type II toxin-antitoxin system HicA family toxin [Pseudomonadota bacterium]MEA3240437.1 type II toxin-antitoxin system HicA family toxin [Pseudomonadota bacterium]